MTEEQRRTAIEMGRRTRREQGLPEKISDPVVLMEVIRLLGLELPARKEPAA